jgi:chemotaxis protein CheC
MEITDIELDAIREFVNIGVGTSAGMLSEMTNSRVDINVPEVFVLYGQGSKQFIADRASESASMVDQQFTGAFDGHASLIFPGNSAQKIVSLLTGEGIGTHGLEAQMISTLSELGNILIHGVVGSIGNLLHKNLIFQIPKFYKQFSEERVGVVNEENNNVDNNVVIVCNTDFTVKETGIHVKLYLIFTKSCMKLLLKKIGEELE